MTKAELAGIIYRVHGGLSKKEANESVDKIFSIIKKNLSQGEEIQISRFGIFNTAHKVERIGRNPQTGEKITISPRKVISFKPAKGFKERLNI